MSKKVYVGNLPFSSSEDDVKSLFTNYGTVTSVKMITDRETGRPRGFCFVEMESDKDASSAISNLDGTDFNGRNIVVNEALEKDRTSRTNQPQRQYSNHGNYRNNNSRDYSHNRNYR